MTRFQLNQSLKYNCRRFTLFTALLLILASLPYSKSFADATIVEPVEACIVSADIELTDAIRSHFDQCLGWENDNLESPPTACRGHYRALEVPLLSDENEIRIMAKEVSLFRQGRSQLKGQVEVQQQNRVINAQTAYVYRDAKSNKVSKIELLGDVHYTEPNRLIIARKALINPDDKSGRIEQALYRFSTLRRGIPVIAWGRAALMERFANQNYRLEQATYSTCAPHDKAWEIQAKTLVLDHEKASAVARHATLRIADWPVLYAPYLSFPTSTARKSGFLMPTVGSSNVGGFDYAQPYYWNMAPNYDATIIPHVYSRRGLMMGGQFRYLTPSTSGVINGRILPDDQAFKHFLHDEEDQYPELRNLSTNRWSMQVLTNSQLAPNLTLGINFQQVSDNYYLQDFSSNLAVLTERQLLRQADLAYQTEHWLFRGLAQSYQTLQPIKLTPIEYAYDRLPQLLAQGRYNDLPLNANLEILGQFDQFRWSKDNLILKPQGPRYHLNPVLTFPQLKPWGYITPGLQVVENYYEVNNNYFAFPNDSNPLNNQGFLTNGFANHEYFNRAIPRYTLDMGLFFERSSSLFNQDFTQTLEPRLYYLYVPYRDQVPIPVYDSGYMIFNVDQLFRDNRFSGFDRIGDSNQLSYALTTRWLANDTGSEKASLTVGQISYFSNRRVQLCQSSLGYCIDNPLTLGYLPSLTATSPIAARALYHLNAAWTVASDYVWEPSTSATNNGHLDFHYQPAEIRFLISVIPI